MMSKQDYLVHSRVFNQLTPTLPLGWTTLQCHKLSLDAMA
jgi:hypothetical protein